MDERDEIYVQILHFALMVLHNHPKAEHAGYCAIEVEHIHNIPSLIGESNEHRHAYYLRAERGLYLERVDRSLSGVKFLLNRYAELWSRLEALSSDGKKN